MPALDSGTLRPAPGRGMTSMREKRKPVASAELVLREEFDDWAILFDPETGNGYGLNPVSVFIWKRLDGRHSEDDILSELDEAFDNVPADARTHLSEFVEELAKRGFVGYHAK